MKALLPLGGSFYSLKPLLKHVNFSFYNYNSFFLFLSSILQIGGVLDKLCLNFINGMYYITCLGWLSVRKNCSRK